MYIRKYLYNDECLEVAESQIKYRDDLSIKTRDLYSNYLSYIKSFSQDVSNRVVESCFQELVDDNMTSHEMFGMFKHYYAVFTKGEEYYPMNIGHKKTNIPYIPNELKDDKCNSWIGREMLIYQKGKDQEDNVEKIINVYSTTFRRKYCFKDVVLYSNINDRQKTRETDNILLTDVGIFVLEVKSYDNLSITDDNKVLGKNNTKQANKANEQARRNAENLRSLLKNVNLDVRIYPLAIVKGYEFSNTDASKDTIATPEEIYDRYIEKKNALSSDELYSEEILDSIKNEIKNKMLKKRMPVKYAYDEEKKEYFIKNRGDYPAFPKILLDDELKEDVDKCCDYVAQMLDDIDFRQQLENKVTDIELEKKREKEEKAKEKEKRLQELEEERKEKEKSDKKAKRSEKRKNRIKGIITLIIIILVLIGMLWGAKFVACVACPAACLGVDVSEMAEQYYK